LDASPELLVEAARACGDLATLIACNPALLTPDEASIATRDAAAAAREILVRTEGGITSSGEQDDYLVRDVRGAIWRADLAVHQVEGSSTGEAPPQELS
jgi:hypothetical protein